jgi:hypothetical protein
VSWDKQGKREAMLRALVYQSSKKLGHEQDAGQQSFDTLKVKMCRPQKFSMITEQTFKTFATNPHRRGLRGRCYDYNFLRFVPIFCKKWRFDQKPVLR